MSLTLDEWPNSFAVKPKILNHDVIAISCAVNRVPGHDLDDADDEVTAEDLAKADLIRSYYGRKLTWYQLSGKPLSKFRTDLQSLLTRDNKNILVHKELGMIYRLPEFYSLDTEFDNLKKDADVSYTNKLHIGKVELTPLKIFREKYSKAAFQSFWFKDPNNRLVLIKIPLPNQLVHMFIDMFNNSATITVNATFAPFTRDSYTYYKLSTWTLEK